MQPCDNVKKTWKLYFRNCIWLHMVQLNTSASKKKKKKQKKILEPMLTTDIIIADTRGMKSKKHIYGRKCTRGQRVREYIYYASRSDCTVCDSFFLREISVNLICLSFGLSKSYLQSAHSICLNIFFVRKFKQILRISISRNVLYCQT